MDELKGGAINTATLFESAAPTGADYSTVMQDAQISQYEGDSGAFFRSAFDMIPRNIYPMWQYNASMQSENPVFVKDALLKGLSGHGAHKDKAHVQTAVAHSLKAYPKLLHMYLNSKNLILPA